MYIYVNCHLDNASNVTFCQFILHKSSFNYNNDTDTFLADGISMLPTNFLSVFKGLTRSQTSNCMK